jgi:hypothetical protein
MDPVATLDGIAEKIAPGRTPAYTAAQALKAMELISDIGGGRQQLAARLSIGEGSARTIIKRLNEGELIITNRGGMTMAKKGIRLLEEIHKEITTCEMTHTGFTVGRSDFAILVKSASGCVRYGVEQRDSALIAGAKGATTLVFDGEQFHIPGIELSPAPELCNELKDKLNPKAGDVVIIGTADNLLHAEIGAISSALELLRTCKNSRSNKKNRFSMMPYYPTLKDHV